MAPPLLLELPAKVQLINIGSDVLFSIAPPKLVAELLENVQLVSVGLEVKTLVIAPPMFEVVLLENVQLLTAGLDAMLYIPPPLSPKLAEKVQLAMVGEDELLFIPPPSVRFIVFVSTVRLPIAPFALPFVTVKPSKTVVLASLTESRTW